MHGEKKVVFIPSLSFPSSDRKEERRVITRVSSPSWSCLGVVGSSQLVVPPLNAQEEPRRRGQSTYVNTCLPSFSFPPSDQRERREERRGRVITRVSTPSWSCLGVEGACLSSAQRPRRTTTRNSDGNYLRREHPPPPSRQRTQRESKGKQGPGCSPA